MELCPNCGNPYDGQSCSCGFTMKKVVSKITIDRSPEVEKIRQEKEALEDELEEKKNILEQQALEEFSQLREKLATKFNDDNILDCESPAEMYDYIASLQSDKPKKPIPKGKAPFVPSDTGAKNYGEFLDELYKTAYYDAEASAEERAEARKQIDELFQSLIEGRSWEQLKRSKRYDALIKTNVESCPNCGKTLIDGATCSCGYDAYSKKHRPKPYRSPLVK